MPTPIISIPVDDQQFRDFMARFAKYREEVKDLGVDWETQHDVVSEVAIGFAAMTKALQDQAESLHEQTEEIRRQEREEDKAAAKKKKEDQEQKDRDKEAARRRKEAIEDTRRIATNVADTVVSLAKWATVGSLGSFAMGSLGFWGLDQFVNTAGRERRLASGFGVSVGEREALDVNMGRFFDANSVLENVANAQADASKQWLFSAMGVNPNGKDAGQLGVEMAMAARRIFMEGHGSQQWAQAHGLLDIFSMDELRRLANAKPGELQGVLSHYQQDITRFQMGDDVGRKWQDFIRSIDEATYGIRNKLLIELTALEGPLEKLTNEMGELAIKVLNRIDFDKVGRGLEQFADYLGSSKFQTDFKTFIDDVSAVVQALTFLGIIPAHPNATGAPPAGVPAPSGPMPGGGLGGSAATFPIAALGGGHAGSGLWDFAATQLAGGQLERWGWTDPQARGILSNLRAESNMNPFAKGDYVKGVATAYGIGQWHADRQALYAKLFGHTMQSVKNPQQAFTEQLEFVQWELTHNFKKAGDDLRRITSAFEAGGEVSREYERPRNETLSAIARGAGALTIVIKNQTGNAVAVQANAAAAGG